MHRQAEVNNPLIDKGNIHQVARGVQGVILSLSASQAEGCGFKSRFPLQRNQALTVKNHKGIFCLASKYPANIPLF